jgi:hypothetical protein
MSELFVKTLMNQVIESTMIPKVQVERIVGPILSVFIADVLTETLISDAVLSGSIEMISPEFPLKKATTKQSTNIDWLMYNTLRKQLFLVELKTSDTSINSSQNEIYHTVKTKIENKSGSFLIDDLETMRDASIESGKYHYLLDKKVSDFKNEISNCHSAKITYIVPKCIEFKIKRNADKVLSFGELSKSIPGKLSKEWQIIHEYLCKLDNLSQSSRNLRISKFQNIPKTTSSSTPKRWKGTLKFDAMVELCQNHGDEIVIGFTGGRTAFVNSSLSYLRNRHYFKWDYSNNMAKKNPSDWIPGNQVINLLEQCSPSSSNVQVTSNNSDNSETKQQIIPTNTRRWQGTFKFDDMVDFCKKHGNEIIIGFTGGKIEFANATLSYLKNRSHYKWDYSKNLAGKNRSDWILGSTVISILVHKHGLSD